MNMRLGTHSSYDVTVDLATTLRGSIFGTNRPDILSSDRPGARLFGRGSSDFLKGGHGSQFLDGGSENDQISGGKDNDVIWGGAGNDWAFGDEGNDWISGDSGDDLLVGGLGRDFIYGGSGNDTLIGGGAVRLYGLTTGNKLVSFTPSGTIENLPIQVTGLDGTLIGIDVRPATGALYGLTDRQKLYTIDVKTGAATFVSTLSPNLLNTNVRVDIDFNPVPDRLRIVNEVEQNLRANVDTGAIAPLMMGGTPGDTPLAYAVIDRNAGKNPAIAGIAYTNSFKPSPDSTRQTTLYAIDYELDTLVTQGGINGQPSPNGGQLFTIADLKDLSGNKVDFSADTGLEIVSLVAGVNLAYATTTVGSGRERSTQVYQIDLSTGTVLPITSYIPPDDGSFIIDVAGMVGPSDNQSNYLYGGRGNDVLIGDIAQDYLYGDSGDDTLFITGGNDIAEGGSGSDKYVFNTGMTFTPDSAFIFDPKASLGISTLKGFESGSDKIVLDKTTFSVLMSNPGDSLSDGRDFASVATDQEVQMSSATITYSRQTGNLFYNLSGVPTSSPGTVTPPRPTNYQFTTIDGKPDLKITDFQVVA